MAQITRFEGGEVCSDTGLLEVGDVWVREGTIIDPMDLFYKKKRAPDLTVDCRGLIVAPGFIDIQINGVCSACACKMHDGGRAVVWCFGTPVFLFSFEMVRE